MRSGTEHQQVKDRWAEVSQACLHSLLEFSPEDQTRVLVGVRLGSILLKKDF